MGDWSKWFVRIKMSDKIKEAFKKIPIKKVVPIVGIILVVVLAVVLLWQGSANSNQSISATPAKVYFVGEYIMSNGERGPIEDGKHISSTQGDVTLRGNFHYSSPGGEYIGVYKGNAPIAFYTDHIHLVFRQAGLTYAADHENPLLGKSACGVAWTAHTFYGGEEIIEIVIHNPHNFGNENAIDEMLSKMAFWVGTDFETGVLDSGATQRNLGLAIIIASVMFLGTAVFSSLIHIKNSKIIWLLGLVILFAGIYFAYSSAGISVWSKSVVFNTSILGISMMLYALFLTVLITTLFQKTKIIGVVTSILLGLADGILFVLPLATKLFFYDMWRYWLIIQGVAFVALMACIVKEFVCAKGTRKLIYIGAFLPLIAFGIDAIVTHVGVWEGGVVSRYIFLILFVVAIVFLLRIIPNSINAIAKAKQLETEKLLLGTELKESRVATMMSQIRPHFIYNTLGSIEQLCELNPAKAGELVHDFAKYLRGNFGELDNPKPILMSKEMEHVHHYINIENVRFPDMTFTFEMNSNDFYIPALTIQPIVENAIKHGLMKLAKGGTIKVVSYETEDSFCVTVEDDGVGFDTATLLDDREHVGIRNIRGRLKAMVNGTLEIESAVGVGTKVLITIPKGEEK